MTTSVTQLADGEITRDRGTRALVFFGSAIGLPLLVAVITASLLYFFFRHEGFLYLGITLGLGLGFIAFLSIKHKFVIKNSSTGMLVTIDQLQSLLNPGNSSHVVYGNGTHFCFPWEGRRAENNISVVEVADDFSFTATCIDGTLTGTGSFRMRPDFKNPLNYLTGVGAVSKDFKDLLITFITDRCSGKTLQWCLDNKNELNTALKNEFAAGTQEFEVRFGVQVGDITVGEFRLSADVEKTRNAINEATVIALGTAKMLGYKTVTSMMRAKSAGKITQEEIDIAQRQFLIVSGNIKDAATKRYEFDIKGLTPEAGAAIAAALKNPNIAQAFTGRDSKPPRSNP